MVEIAPGTPAALVRSFLANLLKSALTSNDHHDLEWRNEARIQHQKILVAPDDLANLKIDGLWWLAIKEAEAPELQPEEAMVEWGQPKTCPFTIAEICKPDFDVDLAVRRVKESAATG